MLLMCYELRLGGIKYLIPIRTRILYRKKYFILGPVRIKKQYGFGPH